MTITTCTTSALELRCEPKQLLRAIETQCEILLDAGRCSATAVEYHFEDFGNRLDRLRCILTLEVQSETLTAAAVLDSALEQFLDSGI